MDRAIGFYRGTADAAEHGGGFIEIGEVFAERTRI